MDWGAALPLIWAGVIAFGVTMYVLLDGFVLGLGILFPFAEDDEERDLMMNSVAPVWDGNETWLVLGGVALFAAFPPAFAFLLSALYLPLIVMLIALVFRGVAFEFRSHSRRRWVWDLSFSAGAMVAAFCQGLVLGTYVQGFEFENGGFAGSFFHWLSPFSLMTGAGVVCAYALLGACWLLIKSEGRLQFWAQDVGLRLLWVILAFILVVSLWTPLAVPAIAERWFSWPNLLYLSPVPLLTAATAAGLGYTLLKRKDHGPFILCVMLYLLNLAGLAISIWPYIVPRESTLWQTASPPETQIFLLVGVAIILPVILVYTAHAYYVFRGKVRPGEGYH